MEDVMASSLSRLPSRFPVGTKFVIEGRPAGDGRPQAFKRYIEFPEGTFVRLPARPVKRATAGRIRRKNGRAQALSRP
jgi:hypothetical protein